MKRQTVLLLLALASGLVLLLIFRKSSTPETPSEKSGEELIEELPGAAAVPAESAVEAVETPAAVPAPAADEPEKEPVVLEKIQENFQTAREAFQKKDVIARSKPEEVHHMPKPTLDAARRLGEIAELEIQHPEQAESFRDFYLECARDTDTITVIRAQCLDKYVKISKMDAASQKQFVRDFPEEVVRLFEALQ
jgi:hypothetical protein